MTDKLDLLGKIFGRLTAIEVAPSRNGKSRWLCRCQCGVVKEIQTTKLMEGTTKSCGCYHAELAAGKNRKHGMTGSRAHQIWMGMLQRCTDPNHKSFLDYGGRGISVCDAWRESFEKFLADMGEPPGGMSIDRYPNTNGNYEPGNCRWATREEQGRNKRTNRLIAYGGQTKPLIEWAEEYKMHPHTLSSRLRYGWDIERALTDPINHRKANRTKFDASGVAA